MTKKELDKMFNESGHGLAWVEFVEKGCPAKKEDYFLTNRDVLEAAKPLLLKSFASKKKELYNKIFDILQDKHWEITDESIDENIVVTNKILALITNTLSR